MDYANLSGNWNYPTAVRAGAGRIKELAGCCKELGMAAPLLVTDPGLASRPMIEEAVAQCRAAGLSCAVFSGVKSNPNGENVTDGVAAYRDGKHNGVIAFGGGSALDAAKAVALMAGQKRPLWDFEDVGDNWLRADSSAIAPIVAVPTTAGTGSEMGRASVISDTQNQIKKIIFHPKMLPSIVILDAELTVGLPAQITAATGMDALSHNLEALCSPLYHPMAEGIAVEGIRLVRAYLPAAVENGADLTARMQMLLASSMGATAFQKGLGGMHALAHPLGALYDAHHGLLNAILMPYVLVANRALIERRLARCARYIDLPKKDFDGFLGWVLDLREKLGIPHALEAIGIDTGQAGLVARVATEDPSAGTNPQPLSAGQYQRIFTAAVEGDLWAAVLSA